MQVPTIIAFYKNNRKIILRVLLVVVLLTCLGFGGKSGWSAFKNYLDDLEQEKLEEIAEIEKQFEHKQDSLVDLKDKYIAERDSIKELKKPIISYWSKFKAEENENKRLRKKLADLRDRQYSQRKLDSFADNARFTPKH